MLLYVVVLTIEVVLLCLFVPSAAGGSIARRKGKADTGYSAVIENVSGGNRHGKTAVLHQYGCFAGVYKCSDSGCYFHVWRYAAERALSVCGLCRIFLFILSAVSEFFVHAALRKQLMPPYQPMA